GGSPRQRAGRGGRVSGAAVGAFGVSRTAQYRSSVLNRKPTPARTGVKHTLEQNSASVLP
ncbi:hypothetical protein, partial [Treponema endosymbiont of Eucomonympha sp.]|uniref:hypothetical protein n=1 Tax=Treponema endosymbiont of Eucomonympha sp. TaxID=1580831 RepID=UPI001E54EF17